MYKAYIDIPPDEPDSMLQIVYRHFARCYSRLKLLLNFWSIKQKQGEAFPEYTARIKTEYAMSGHFQGQDEFLGFKTLEGITDFL